MSCVYDSLTILSYVFTIIYVIAFLVMLYEAITEIKSLNLLRKLKEVKEYSKNGVDVIFKSGEVYNIFEFAIEENITTKNTKLICHNTQKMFRLKDIKELKD